jgi:hypothetical protein
MSSVTAPANIPLPIKARSAKTHWVAYGIIAICMVTGPCMLAALLSLLPAR